MPTLPDIKSRVSIDDSQLSKTSATAAKTGAALKEHLGAGSASAKALETRLGAVGGALTHLGPAGQIAGSALQDVSTAATALGAAGGIAIGGLFAIAGAALYAESRYEKLVGRIDNFQDVVGGSAESASRMVHTLDVLGVSTDTATGAMFKLSRAIGENPEKLSKLGVEIKRTSDGNTDLMETLYSVSDAYNATSDSSRRTAILFAAFGKGGAAMIDVVERGSDSLRKLAASTSLVITDEDISRMREYKITQQELKSAWDEWVDSMAQKVFPALDAGATALLRNRDVAKQLREAVDAGTISELDYQEASLGLKSAASELSDKLLAEWDAAHKVKHEIDLAAEATRQAAAANEALWAAVDKVITQQEGQANSGDALKRAQLAVSESQGRINAAQVAYTEAVKEFGANSDQALVAANNVIRAHLDQEKALRDVGSAARKLQEDTDLLSGKTKDVAADVQAEMSALDALAATLAPSSELRTYLDRYINDLQNRIPRDVQTRITLLETHLSGRQGGNLSGYAEGGRPPVNRDVLVGEWGPERVRFDSPATIYPPGQAPPAGSPSAGDTYITNVTAVPNADPYEIAAEVGWTIRTLRRTM